MSDFRALYEEIGYAFHNERLLARALTHKSADIKENYETLEFLGDSVVNYAVSEMLFRSPSLDPGEMTERRKSMVSREPLAALSDRLGFSERCVKNGCALSEKMRCDLYEAVTAAILLDGGFEAAVSFVKRTISLADSFVDFKSKVKELCEKNKWSYDAPHTESGPETNKKFTVEVYVNGKSRGFATARNIKTAENEACAIALKALKGE
ncbi:MAG: hypothetical protein K5753_01115 [Clostridia bacterium]|nr:hypothetical protein [Clostridia bacterium]